MILDTDQRLPISDHRFTERQINFRCGRGERGVRWHDRFAQAAHRENRQLGPALFLLARVWWSWSELRDRDPNLPALVEVLEQYLDDRGMDRHDLQELIYSNGPTEGTADHHVPA